MILSPGARGPAPLSEGQGKERRHIWKKSWILRLPRGGNRPQTLVPTVALATLIAASISAGGAPGTAGEQDWEETIWFHDPFRAFLEASGGSLGEEHWTGQTLVVTPTPIPSFAPQCFAGIRVKLDTDANPGHRTALQMMGCNPAQRAKKCHLPLRRVPWKLPPSSTATIMMLGTFRGVCPTWQKLWRGPPPPP